MKQIISFLLMSSLVFLTACSDHPSQKNTFEKTNSLQIGKIESIENLGFGFVSCQMTIDREENRYYGIGLTSDSLKVGTQVKIFSTGTGTKVRYLIRKL